MRSFSAVVLSGLLLSGWLLWSAPAPAEPKPAAPSQPTELTSDQMELWSTDTETFGICVGNVVLIGTNLKITCDRLEVIAVRVGDKAPTIGTLESFKYLLASGNVHIIQGDREATCGRAEVLPLEDKLVLTESPVLNDRGTGYVGAGEKITLLRGERRVLIDQPRVVGPPLRDLSYDAKDPAPNDKTIGPPPQNVTPPK